MRRWLLAARVLLTMVAASLGTNGCSRLNTAAEPPATVPRWGVVAIAHRGGVVPGYPENTLAAFRQAIALGADVVEIDLRGTKDGEVVILHDPTLERTTDGRGPVIEHTLAQLKQLDAGNGERIPTYQEVLRLARSTGVKLLLDIKDSPGLNKEQVVRLTEAHGAELDVIVGARAIEDLEYFRARNPNLRTLGFIAKVQDVDPFVVAGADIIRLWRWWIGVSPGLVEKVHRLGKPVWASAADAPREELERLVRFGVNGILSDRPQAVAEAMAVLGKARAPHARSPHG